MPHTKIRSNKFSIKAILENVLLGIVSFIFGFISIISIIIGGPASALFGALWGNAWFPGYAGLISWLFGSAIGLVFICIFVLCTPRGASRFFWIALCGLLPLLAYLLFVFVGFGNNPMKLSIAIDIVFLCLALALLYKSRRPA